MARINKYDYILKYIVTAKLSEPLHIGSSFGDATDILVHPVDNIPFIQASSIAGMLRDYTSKTFGEERASLLFGVARNPEDNVDGDNNSRLIISDGSFRKDSNLMLELRPHVAIEATSGSAKKSALYKMEYIGSGSIFDFELVAYADKENVEIVSETIKECLSAISSGEIQIGGRKSIGCGFVTVERLFFKQFDMRDKDDRDRWKNDSSNIKNYNDITSTLTGENGRRVAYTITVDSEPEGNMLIKSIAPKNKKGDAKNVDVDSIRNALGKYIVPGSSLKGVLRSRVSSIASYLKEHNQITDDELVKRMFGTASDKEQSAVVGNVIVRDAVIQNAATDKISRIHIDKFTGGVFNKGLFSEETVTGDRVVFTIDVLEGEFADESAAMLLLAIRDLMLKTYSLGSGFNIGRGFLNVNSINLEDRKTKNKYYLELNKDGRDTLSDFATHLLSKLK